MQCFPAPDFCIVRSTKLTVWVGYSIPGDAYGLRKVVAKSRQRLKITSHLIKVMIEFIFLMRSYIKNISKYKVQFSDHIYKNVMNFSCESEDETPN